MDPLNYLLLLCFPRIVPKNPENSHTQSLSHLYTHIHRLSQAVNRVSVGLDVAHTQSCHLEEQTEINHHIDRNERFCSRVFTLLYSHSGWFHWGSASSSPHCEPLPACVSEDPIGLQDQWEGYLLASVSTPGFGRWDLNSPLVRIIRKLVGNFTISEIQLMVILLINSKFSKYNERWFKFPQPNLKEPVFYKQIFNLKWFKTDKSSKPSHLRSWNLLMFAFLLDNQRMMNWLSKLLMLGWLTNREIISACSHTRTYRPHRHIRVTQSTNRHKGATKKLCWKRNINKMTHKLYTRAEKMFQVKETAALTKRMPAPI